MEKTNNFFFRLLLILAGNTIYALAVVMFIVPNHLLTGGATGLALFSQHLFQIPISRFVLVFNFAMFVLGAFVLGKRFAVTTLISTFYYPVALGVFEQIPGLKGLTSDNLLATIFAGLLIGIGIGVVIKMGASTGGMDIPPLILHKKWGVSISFSLYLFDFIILILQILISEPEQVLYGILLVLLYTVVLDKVLINGNAKTQVKIVSEKYEAICGQIIRQLDRGVTLLRGETGYRRHDTAVVLTVVSNRELPKLNELVLSIDEKAFMIINQVNEVKGRGFSMKKVYK